MTRPEKVQEAQRLRSEGLTQREIAAVMGVRRGTASDWLNDPDGSKLRARKNSYRGTCETCGSPTHGSNGPSKAPRFCRIHAPAENAVTVYTRELLIAEAHRFARVHSRPPVIDDWNPHDGNADQRRDFHMNGWPWFTSVNRQFGSWNAMIVAAGYEPLPAHGPRRGHGRGDRRVAA